MKKKKMNMAMLYFFIFIIILSLTYLGAKYYCLTQSKVLFSYSFSRDNQIEVKEDVYITVSVSKKWDDSASKNKNPIGAQYDGVIINNSKTVFKNWEVVLEFSEDLNIDSSWNGSFYTIENKVRFVAEGEPGIVLPKSYKTFGAVMYSDKILELKSYTLEGYKEVSFNDMPLWKILIMLFSLWLIALIIYIGIYYKTFVYKKRLELDSQIILQSMNTLTSFIDAKDPYTKNHSTRVAIYSSELGRCLKMNKIELDNLYYIALMHDCGKIGIPDRLLNDTGNLSEEEYKIVQSHTSIGQKMLGDFTAIPNIRNGAYYHHERYDGKGYPENLKGPAIPLCARIISIADAYDAMSNDRCYRKALSKEQILSEMKLNSGKQFDPEINSIMILLIEGDFFDEIKQKYPIL